MKTLEPYIERVEGQEKVQTGQKFILDYNELLKGVVSWMLIEIEINQMKNKKGKD